MMSCLYMITMPDGKNQNTLLDVTPAFRTVITQQVEAEA